MGEIRSVLMVMSSGAFGYGQAVGWVMVAL
jgi:hypothetical protein